MTAESPHLSSSAPRSVGIAGMGAIGDAVAKALLNGIRGFELHAVSDIAVGRDYPVPNVDFQTLARECDLIIEALPPAVVPALMTQAFQFERDVIAISACALLMFPKIIEDQKRCKKSRIIVPSGALIGIDGVNALAQLGIKRASIATTKPPRGYAGAPYIIEHTIDLDAIGEKTLLFSGNALEAAQGFPANVNVAATLSLAGIGAERTQVEIWADPQTATNTHHIIVESEFSRMEARVENKPDPANPKSSMLAAQSIVAVLKGMNDPIAVL